MEWNKKINLVSRKKKNVFDLIDESRMFLEYIIPHPCLNAGGTGRQANSLQGRGDKEMQGPIRIMDLGTGGGFPGIVIRIHKPEIKMVLVESIMKKVTAVCDIISRLGLKNITAMCMRAEDMAKNNVFKHTFDYITARSVAELNELVMWSRGLLKPGGKLITLKGGDICDELSKTKRMKCVKDIEVYEKGGRKVIITIMLPAKGRN